MGEERSELNYGWFANNWEGLIAAAQDTTFNIGRTGTDTETSKYLIKYSTIDDATGDKAMGTGFVLRPNKTVQIIQINETVFDYPITVSTGGLSWTKHLVDLNKIIIRTTVTDTVVKLLVT